MAIELYPHQRKAIEQIHNGCVLKGGVGSGKTLTSLAYFYTQVAGGSLKVNAFGGYAPPTAPIDLYVCTTAKKRDSLDWQHEASMLAISTNRELSAGGIKLTVISWNEVTNFTDVKGAFWIFDEARAGGSGAWAKAFIKLAKQNQWIMLSATPGDNWMDYIPIFVANGWYKNRSQFVAEHVVFSHYGGFPKVDKYVNVGKLFKLRKLVLVDMPFERHTKRHIYNVVVDHDAKTLKRITEERWNIYEERPIKDIGEMFLLMRKHVNASFDRSRALSELTEKHDRLIVFYTFNFELDMLRGIAEVLDIPYAEWNGHKHQEIPVEEKWLYFVQYSSGNEGWNCTETDAMVFWSQQYSYKIFEQAQGRIDRMNTPFTDLHYYVFKSMALIDVMIAKKIKEKTNFNEAKAARELGFKREDFALAA